MISTAWGRYRWRTSEARTTSACARRWRSRNGCHYRPDTITFASGPGEAFENGGTIRLSQALGELVIASDVTIDGDIDGDPASHNITIDAQGHSRVLNVTGGSPTIEGLVITGGAASDGGGVNVTNTATLTVRDSSISGNSAFKGGGIYIDIHGAASLSNTTVSGNRSDADNARGGGIHNAGELTLTDTSVVGNRYIGISNEGNATLANVTVSDNKTIGIWNTGTATNVQFPIRNDGTAILTNTTVSGNDGYGI